MIVENILPLEYSSMMKEKFQNTTRSNILYTASKIQVFTLKEWDKMVYIDADTIFLQNADELFEYPDGAMIKYPNDPYGFSGLFVFCPGNHDEDDFYPTVMREHFCADGDLLGKFWFFVKTSKAH